MDEWGRREILTLRTMWRTPAVANGRMKKGSGTVRFENHNVPPVSRPGTGSFAIPLSKKNVPNPIGACNNGTRAFQYFTPALLFIIWSSARILIVSAVSPCRLASFIFSIRGLARGATIAIFAALSVPIKLGYKQASRTISAVKAIEAHHGVPARTWTCSRTHSIIPVGP